MQRDNAPLAEISESILPEADPLPSFAERADSLTLWTGKHQRSPTEQAKVSALELSAWIGAMITPRHPDRELNWLLNHQKQALSCAF
jgi:hypothetical protein